MRAARIEVEPGAGGELVGDLISGALQTHPVEVRNGPSGRVVSGDGLVTVELARGPRAVPGPRRLGTQGDLEVVGVEDPRSLLRKTVESRPGDAARIRDELMEGGECLESRDVDGHRNVAVPDGEHARRVRRREHGVVSTHETAAVDLRRRHHHHSPTQF